MGFGELMFAGVPVYGNALDAVHADEVREALDWYFGSAGNELHQFGQILLRVLRDDLPKPDDDLICWVVAGVVRVFLHVLHVHLGHPRNEQLQLLGLEIADALLGDDLVEPFQKSVELRRKVLPHFGHAVFFNIL